MSTPREDQVFVFIRDRIEQLGRAPKLIEISEHFRFSNPRASKIVASLVKQGRLIKLGSGTRGLVLPGRVDLSSVETSQLQAELARRGKSFGALDEPTRFTGGRPCAAFGCISKVQRGRLFCRPHWFALPEALRARILTTWAARDIDAYGEAVEEARNEFMQFTRVVERVE